MFKIAIVEDQEETRECLNRFVRQYAEEQGLQVEISLIADGSEIAVHYTPGFDIIFMDVEMPRLDGFAAAEAIRAVDAEVVLVFVTNMAQYAIRGYEVDALVFCLPLRHRAHFWARACGMLIPLLLLLVLYISFFVLLAGMIYLCTDINKEGAMYCAVWSLLIAQCAYEGWCFLELQFARYGHPLNMASPWAVLVQLLSGAVFFAAVYLLLARQLPYKRDYHIGPRQLFSAFFIGILFMVQAAVLDNFRAEQFPRSLIATILIGQFYFITLLYFQSELFKKSAMEKEMNALNLLYERQRQQYQVARQNVQMINKRCHELKVQIANLRKLSPEAVPQERIEEAERAARLYDANCNTGNEVLDVVLTEKSLLCESRGIQLNAVANGSCLGFIEAGDLYALFANALDHAVESAVQTARPECRVIDLLVCVRQGFVVVNIISPLRPPEQQANRSAQYELKVIRRIVQKYKGTLTLEEQGKFFAEKIIFPLQK